MQRHIQKAFWGFLFLASVLLFQNCGHSSNPVLFSDAESNKSSSSSTEGNGQGYDGKIFVVMGDKCPDGTKLRSRIVLKSANQADLTRYECQELANPVLLGPQDFEINPNNPQELKYQNQIFINQLVGIKLDMSQVRSEIGNCYQIDFNFGTPADNTNANFQSLLQIYEDGVPLGPAHTPHVDIRNQGLGRFSHWEDSGISSLRFSASDNSNPLTNGRTYTWDIRN